MVLYSFSYIDTNQITDLLYLKTFHKIYLFSSNKKIIKYLLYWMYSRILIKDTQLYIIHVIHLISTLFNILPTYPVLHWNHTFKLTLLLPISSVLIIPFIYIYTYEYRINAHLFISILFCHKIILSSYF